MKVPIEEKINCSSSDNRYDSPPGHSTSTPLRNEHWNVKDQYSCAANGDFDHFHDLSSLTQGLKSVRAAVPINPIHCVLTQSATGIYLSRSTGLQGGTHCGLEMAHQKNSSQTYQNNGEFKNMKKYSLFPQFSQRSSGRSDSSPESTEEPHLFSKLHPQSVATISSPAGERVESGHTANNLRFNRRAHPVIKTSVAYAASSALPSMLTNPNHVKDFCQADKKAKGLLSSRQVNTSCRVLKVVNCSNVSIQELCNLFSNFGNVESGQLDIERKCAYIKYTSYEGAASGLKHLNKLSLNGEKLQVQYDDSEEGVASSNRKGVEVFIIRESCKRFKAEVPKHANPVSRTLHVCIFFNNKRRFVSDDEILSILSHNSIIPIRLQRDWNKENVNMWFVEFSSIQESLKLIMKTHDYPLKDGNVRISFTKTKRN